MSKHIELPNFADEVRKLVGEERALPPVENWHPQRVGEVDIRIAKDGVWHYQDEPMQRESMVRLFASILRRDGEEYYLVTPAEKMKITVDDVPFVVRIMDVEGEGEAQKLHFSTNVGDSFTLSEKHPLRVVLNDRGEPSPYVTVRRNLEALLLRPVYYELAELALASEADADVLGVWSSGKFFALA